MKTKQHFYKRPLKIILILQKRVKESSSVESSNSSIDTAQQPSHTTINREESVQTSDNVEDSHVSDFANSK